jgi:hypothetical protein
MHRFLVNYVQRHQNRWNQLLHLIGVPLTFGVSIVLLVAGENLWALWAFLGGYALQFAGHAIEGNDAGEIVLLKCWLGLPYREFGPKALAEKMEQSKSND